MGNHLEIGGLDSDVRSGQHTATRRRLATTVAIAVFFAVGSPTVALVGEHSGAPSPAVEASADSELTSPQLATPTTRTSFHRSGDRPPDRIADYTGGIAARVHSHVEPIPGDLFLLMAVAGSDAAAHLYDQTPYLREGLPTHPEAVESNVLAVQTVEDITGADVQMLDFTSAPGGGPSAGVTYAIAYLNIISDGAFTGDLVVAATGRLGLHGYVYPINSINEKTAAASLAGADVLFTPSTPAADIIDVHGTRVVGELFRARNTGSALSEERQWNHYDRWGANRPDDDMDVVGIRHIGDVAAYLCGAGSVFACDVTFLLENIVTDTAQVPNQATPGTGPLDSTRAQRGIAKSAGDCQQLGSTVTAC